MKCKGIDRVISNLCLLAPQETPNSSKQPRERKEVYERFDRLECARQKKGDDTRQGQYLQEE